MYTFNTKFTLNEKFRLTEAEDFDLNTDDRQQELLTSLVQKIQTIIQTKGNEFINAGITNRNELNTLEIAIKNLMNILNTVDISTMITDDEIEAKTEKIKSTILNDSGKVNPQTADIDLLELTTEITELTKLLSQGNTEYDELATDSDNGQVRSGIKTNNKWAELLDEAQTPDEKNKVWDRYYAEVWKENASIVKNLAEVVQNECLKLGFIIDENPCLKYLSWILSKNIPITHTKYGIIHNALVKDELSLDELKKQPGTSANIIWCKDLFNKDESDMREYLASQYRYKINYNTRTDNDKTMTETFISTFYVSGTNGTNVENAKLQPLKTIEQALNKLGIKEKVPVDTSNMVNKLLQIVNQERVSEDKKNVYIARIAATILGRCIASRTKEEIINKYSARLQKAEPFSLGDGATKKIDKLFDNMDYKDNDIKDIVTGLLTKSQQSDKTRPNFNI